MAAADETRRRRTIGYLGRTVALALLALFMALLVYGLVSQPVDDTLDTALADAKAPPAPDFELSVLQKGSVGPRLDTVERAAADGSIALAELRGVPVVLNFWASWCAPCREEAPRLERHWRAGREQGMLVLGLDMQDLTGDAREFLGEFGVTYPNVRDPGNEVAREWGVTGLPETFFISARGRVVGHVIGAISAQQLDDGARAAVAGRALAPREGGDRRSTR